jgi:hypothetical protein
MATHDDARREDDRMDQYNANMDAWVAQQQAQLQAEQHQWMMHFVRLYRAETGDYQTPDALAFERGLNLYCARNAAECRDVHDTYSEGSRLQHESNMRDIASWGAVNAGIAASNASILDASHQGFRDRSAMQDQGQANLIQGAVQGQWNYVHPSTGAQWSLPVQPDPHTQYWTPEGQPLSYDFQSGVWYVGTQLGWTPLQPQR